MESPRKFNDCYFYYYSTCTKGDNCVFRHEPSALGCETMCSAWQQGKCMDKRCKLRHMELRKNRKQIPCYWENQPGGCRKKHCPFMHKNPDARTDGIAPSQPAPIQPAASVAPTGAEAAPLASGTSAACVEPLSAHPPHPLPLLWQHQHQQPRQVVLDSTILGVLPGVGRSPLPAPHAAHEQYALPIDPLVVNFDEESDNESAPSSTPTKQPPDDDGGRSKSHELALLERIQAEAAAFYRYDPAPAAAPRAAKYDRLSLDDLAGNKHPPAPTERRKSLDFKVLSLEEIRARKKAEAILQSTPITLNLSRKRKLSTQETVTSTGNKIIKVIRSNSIVYKKVDPNAPPPPADVTKPEQKQTEQVETRKRTLSEQTADIYNMQEDELVDDCHEFKRIKITRTVSKPRLIRNRHIGLEKGNGQLNELDTSNKTDESDSEVQIVSVDITENTSIDLSDSEVIEVAPSRLEPIDIDSSDDDDVTITSSDFPKNVPDVVASCRRKSDNADKDILKDIDSILNDNTDSVEEL